MITKVIENDKWLNKKLKMSVDRYRCISQDWDTICYMPRPWFIVAFPILAPPLTLCLVILADFLLTKEPTFGFLLALKKYAQWRKYYIQGFFIMRELRTASKDLKKCQDAELKKLLQLNSDTEYHKTWHLDQVETRDDYVRIQPLVKYTHFESFFERMIRGEEKVMTSQSPMYYAITSGTTGRPSKIPWIKYQLDNVNRLRALQAYNAGNIIHGVRNLSRVSRQ